MDYQSVINKRIHDLCEKYGLSITGLAVAANLRPTTLLNIMQGKVTQKPKIENLHRIAFVFKMTLAEFFDFPEMEELAAEYFRKLESPKK